MRPLNNLKLGVAFLCLATSSTLLRASSHMDAPLITFDDPANTTDVYAFRSSNDGVEYLTTALAVYPFEEPGIGPNKYNFDDNVLYEIHVALGDDVAAGRKTISYRFRFDTTYKNDQTILQSYTCVVMAVDDACQNLTQTYTVNAEYLLCAASLEQARLSYLFSRADLEPTGEYRFLDSVTRIGITHKATNTRLRVMSSKAKSAFGIVGCPLLVGDEPGCWETVNGQLMADAIQTAQGKPGSAMRVVLIGTLAPSTGGWWHDLVGAGSNGTTYVQRLRGDVKRWDSWGEIRRCNPLVEISPEFRKKLLDERDRARRDPRLRARFCSYRLNSPTGDESTMLLTVSDFENMTKRPVPPRVGKPLVAVDLGANRAWSAALALWPNGRIECRAVAPGLPNLEDQEKRDRVPRGAYQKLADQGVLSQAEGLRVPPPSMLVELISKTWGQPASLICDRFRLDELRDAGVPCRVVPRVTRWSEASYPGFPIWLL